jgi:hypothetical protein
MPSSRMLRRVALVETDVSEEPRASIIRVTIGELGTTFAVTNRRTLRRDTSILDLVFLRSVRQLLVTTDVPSSPILVTQIMETLHSS